MKNLYLQLLAIAFFFNSSGQTTLNTVDFESASGWSLSHTFDDGASDYCKRDAAFNGQTGYALEASGNNYVGAEDTDAEPGSPSNGIITLDFDPVITSGYTSLQVRFDISANTSANYDQRSQSNGDYLDLQVNIDGGGWNTVGSFCSPSGSSNRLYNDADLDGIGGETAEVILDKTIQSFTFDVGATGNSLDYRVIFRFDAGSEEIAMDNFEVIGTAASVDTEVSFAPTSGSASETAASHNLPFAIAAASGSASTTITIQLTGGNPAFTNAFASVGSTINIVVPANNNTFNYALDINDNATCDGPETLTFQITNVTGGQGTPAIGTNDTYLLTITDDEQTSGTIAFQGFESGDTWAYSNSGGASSTTNTGFPTGERIRSGSNSYQLSNGTGTLTLDNGGSGVNISTSSNVVLDVWTASIAGTSGNGADDNDQIKLYVSQTSVFGATPDITIDGSSNVKYGISGSGSVTTTAGSPVTFDYPSGGTQSGDDAKSLLSVNIPDSWNALFVKVEVMNNSTSETWCIDDITLSADICNTTPLITVVPAALNDFGNVCVNDVSAVQSYTISGTNLTGDLNISAPAGYEIRTGAGAYGSSLALAPLSGNVPNTLIDVRFAPIAVQSYPGTIENSSSGAIQVDIAVTGVGVNTSGSVTTTAVSSITTNSAASGGTATEGCQSVTVRGVVFDTSPAPTINATSDGTGPGGYTSALTGLTGNTTYFYRAYIIDATGTIYGDELSFTTLKPEPADHPIDFTCGATSSSSIPLSWTDASSVTVPDGYLIKWSSVSFAAIADPVDGSPEANGSNSQNVVQGTEAFTAPGLTSGTTYYFKIFPYTNSGTAINYKTDAPVQQTSCATLSGPCLETGFTDGEGWQDHAYGNWTEVDPYGIWTAFGTFAGSGSVNRRIQMRDVGNWLQLPDIDNPVSLEYYGGLSSSPSGSNRIKVQYFNGSIWVDITEHTAAVSSMTLYTADLSSLTSLTGVQLRLYRSADDRTHYIDDVAVYCGTGCTPPATQASFATVTDPTSTTLDINWTAGSGTHSLVVVREGSPVGSAPSSGTAYTADAAFGGGSDIGSGEFVIYNGTGSAITVTGLDYGTTYHVSVFSFNVADDCYNALSPAQTSGITDCGPIPDDVTGAVATNAEGGQVTLSWTNPDNCFNNILIFASENNCTTNSPMGLGGAYSPADAVFGMGDDDLDPGIAYLVYKGTGTTLDITGLTNQQQYCIIIYVRNGSTWSTGVEVTVTPDYCSAASTNTLNEYIQGVEFNTIANTSGPTEYTDFTSISTTLERGVTYPMTVFVGDYFPEDSCLAWIDWNNNGIFENPAERVMASYGSAPFTTAITVPLTAELGSTRLRIRLYDELVGVQNDSPCGTHEYGEVEDYSILVVDPCLPVHSVSGFIPASGPEGTDVTITGNGFTSGTTVEFDGIPAMVTFVDATTLIAEVPPLSATGAISVFEAGCVVYTADFVVIDNAGQCTSTSGFTDIFISEVFDGEFGNVFYLELFNPTAVDVDLDAVGTDYILKVDNRNAGSLNVTIDRTIDLTGVIQAGQTLVYNFGTGSACPSDVININDGGPGINEYDYIFLAKNAVDVDRVNLPGEIGYSSSRNASASGPTTTYSAADWTDVSSETCDDLGIGTLVFNPPPMVTSIADLGACDIDFSVMVTEGDNSVLNDIEYKWYYHDGSASTWSVVNDINLPSFNINGETSNRLTISGVTPPVTLLDGYQFYCEVTEASSCSQAGNAATFTAKTDPYFRTAASGDWNTVAIWEMSDDGTNNWVPACQVPSSTRAKETRILNGHYVTIIDDLSLAPDVSIDSLVIEEGGTLEITPNGELHIENTAGTDLTIDGTLIDRANSGNGIVFNGSTWTIGSDDTIKFTNNGSVAAYRDNYEGGISNITADAHWFFSYNGDGDVAVLSIDMYYPNLYFESTFGSHDFSAFAEIFAGRSGYTTILGDLHIGVTGTGAVKVINNNFNLQRMLILGGLYINTGSELTNEPYVALPNGNYNVTYREGSGFELRGDALILGTLDATHYAVVGVDPVNAIPSGEEGLVFSKPTGLQDILGDGTMITRNAMVNATDHVSLDDIDLEVDNILTFADGRLITDISKDDKVIIYNTAVDAVQGAALTGGVGSNFIQGKLQRRLAGSNTYIFPVGDDGTYEGSQPVSLTARGAGNADVLAYVELGDQALLAPAAFCDIGEHPGGPLVPTANTCVGGPDGILDFIHINLESPLQWSVTLESGSLSDYDLTVSPSSSQDVGAYTLACGSSTEDLRWLMKNGAPGEGIPVRNDVYPFTGVDGFTSCPNQYTLSGMTSFSKFRLHGANLPNTLLPVELIDFEAGASGRDALLSWRTASEVNSDYFDVQHSLDGLYFESIDNVNGQGTTSGVHDYETLHARPPMGLNYYRLRMVDLDGTFEYSPVRTVSFDVQADFEVINTMAGGSLEVQLPASSLGGMLTIYAMNGQVVYFDKLPSTVFNSSLSIDVSWLPNAVYAIQWYDGYHLIEKKFLKF